MRPPMRSSPRVVVGVVSALLVSAAAIFALLGLPGRPTLPSATLPLAEHVGTSTAVPNPTVTAADAAAVPTATGTMATEPTATVAATTVPPTAARATATPAHPVELTLSSIQPLSDQGGLIVTIDIANNRSSPLDFNFDPTYDVQVHDAQGKSWPLRWAAYHGVETVPSLGTDELTHAFFAGNISSSTVWPLTVTVNRVPDAGQVTWTAPKDGAPTESASALPSPKPPPPDTAGPVTATVINPLPSSELGGVQVDLQLQNNQSTDLVFQFDPNNQLSAVDNLGHAYYVRWAQYNGTIRVPAHTSTQLARVFFSGAIDSGNPAWFRVSVRQVPGTSPVTATTPLD